MRENFLVYAFAALIPLAHAADPMPSIREGHIDRMANVVSKFVTSRNVDVWLPPGYDGTVRCPVIYMQDGQALFDPSLVFSKKSWNMAETTAALIRDGKIPPTILVGIWNTGTLRHSEYFPEKVLPFVPEEMREKFVRLNLNGKPSADNYLRFIVQELKPAIDAKYATLHDKKHTIVMGSSMGGIISLYAICEYPDIFGAAGCMSTHWPGFLERNSSIPLATFIYLQGHLPSSADHRIYCDRGTATLDALYPEAQSFVDLLFRDKGYDGKNYKTLVFQGDDHTENSWARRVAIPLTFLDGK